MADVRRTVSIEELSKRLGDLQKKLPAAARAAMRSSVWAMIRDVVMNRMSGQYLGVVTSTARRSMHATVERRGDSVRGVIGNPHDYVRAHEMGFHGPVQVRAHTRQLARLERGVRTGKVTKKSARKYKARRKKGYAMSASVRAHTRQVNIRAKRFIRDTLADEAVPYSATRAQAGNSRIERRVLRALEILAETGKTPKAADIKV